MFIVYYDIFFPVGFLKTFFVYVIFILSTWLMFAFYWLEVTSEAGLV